MDNKIAVVTGATSGIGAAYANKFAKQGYDLILIGRRKEKIEETGQYFRREYGVNVEILLAELTEQEDVKKVTEFIKEKNVEVLVNNAGFGVTGLYPEADLAVMEQLAKVSTLAPMQLIYEVLPGMIIRKKGTIINISSESVYMVVPGNAIYSAAKAFLKTFTEGLYMDLQGTGVKVLAVCPGLTHTDFHEKMGMEKSRQTDKGMIQWMSPEKVVEDSLKDLEKGRVISIPGSHTKILAYILSTMPRSLYYKMLFQFSKKYLSKR